jgi:hypothetical protein
MRPLDLPLKPFLRSLLVGTGNANPTATASTWLFWRLPATATDDDGWDVRIANAK